MKIGKYNVKDELVEKYVSHLNRGIMGDITKFEQDRKELHESIFKFVKLDRHTDKGQEFSRELDKFCAELIIDPFQRDIKLVCACKDSTELDTFKAELLAGKSHAGNEILAKYNYRAKKSSNKCRVCKKDLPRGVARYNDHLTTDKVDSPICCKCSKDKPDAHFLNFEKRYLKPKEPLFLPKEPLFFSSPEEKRRHDFKIALIECDKAYPEHSPHHLCLMTDEEFKKCRKVTDIRDLTEKSK